MTETQSGNKNQSDDMPTGREREIQTTIRVPESRYALLEELKKIQGKSINSLVVDGVELLILKNKDKIVSNIKDRTNKVTSALDELEKE